MRQVAATLSTLRADKERWRIECERLANGLLEQFEERAGDANGELKPEQAVDVAFRLLDELGAEQQQAKAELEAAEQRNKELEATNARLRLSWREDVSEARDEAGAKHALFSQAERARSILFGRLGDISATLDDAGIPLNDEHGSEWLVEKRVKLLKERAEAAEQRAEQAEAQVQQIRAQLEGK